MLDHERFAWGDPVDDDRWNFDYDAKTVAVGRYNGQIVVRIYEKTEPRKDGSDRFRALLRHHERTGGASSNWIAEKYDQRSLCEFVEDYLFGALRNWAVCSSCGLAHNPMGTMNAGRLVALGICFFCDIWLTEIQGPRKPNKFVADGCLYSIGEVHRVGTPSHCKGYGGQRWRVEMQDGRVIETDNLWNGGEIPAHLRGLLPDSAILASASEARR